MKIEYDPVKSRKNELERGLPFSMATLLDWDSATYREDIRKDYPERRFVATGYLSTRLHIVCFTPCVEGIRVISFRKANKREIKAYEQETANR